MIRRQESEERRVANENCSYEGVDQIKGGTTAMTKKHLAHSSHSHPTIYSSVCLFPCLYFSMSVFCVCVVPVLPLFVLFTVVVTMNK